MTKTKQKLSDSKLARWTVLGIVSVTMMCGYFITDVMAPLQPMLEKEFGWNGTEYGLFTGAYGWFNVMLFMLIISGIILDRKGMRFTGTLACCLMLAGCAIKYFAISKFFDFDGTILGINARVAVACLGFAIFGVGAEATGISITKIIAKWFKGKEIALAMGLQVAMARIGTALALSVTVRLAKYFQDIAAPVLLGVALLSIGLVFFLVFCIMDRKLDATIENENAEQESFKINDVTSIVKIKGFRLIALLCVLFYSAVFPFLKFATSLMINKYGVDENLAGDIPALLPFGTILLTPFFGGIYDKKGKGATIMIVGAALLLVVHTLFALPIGNVWWFAMAVMIVLGMAFSLVPSAMWPSVAKIIPQQQLGTAYACIFWVQNIGLAGVPMIIGWVLNTFCQTGNPNTPYDYTIPMIVFATFGLAALGVAVLLKKENEKMGFGLEAPNQKK